MKLIAIEGIDASGKETQCKLLYNYFKSKGKKVAKFSFPRYHTPIGKVLKEWFCSKNDLSDEAVHMLLEADRVDFMSEVNKYRELGYDYLVLDRFTLSNLAYGLAKSIDLDWLKQLQKYTIKPDITFLLDIPVQVSLSRKSERDRHEVDLQLLNRVRRAYTFLSETDPCIFKIDASKATPEQLHESIVDYIVKAIEYEV